MGYDIEKCYHSTRSGDTLVLMRGGRTSVSYDHGTDRTGYLFNAGGALVGYANYFQYLSMIYNLDPLLSMLLSFDIDGFDYSFCGDEDSWCAMFYDFANGDYEVFDGTTSSPLMDRISIWIDMDYINEEAERTMLELPRTTIIEETDDWTCEHSVPEVTTEFSYLIDELRPVIRYGS